MCSNFFLVLWLKIFWNVSQRSCGFLFTLPRIDFPGLHKGRFIVCFWTPGCRHFRFPGALIISTLLLKMVEFTSLNKSWFFIYFYFFLGLAHCGVFQQRYVNPILSGDHTVAHSKGKGMLCHSTAALITLLASFSGSITQGRVVLYTQISWVMQITMGTSPTETLSVAGNIFIGQVTNLRSFTIDHYKGVNHQK